MNKVYIKDLLATDYPLMGHSKTLCNYLRHRGHTIRKDNKGSYIWLDKDVTQSDAVSLNVTQSDAMSHNASQKLTQKLNLTQSDAMSHSKSQYTKEDLYKWYQDCIKSATSPNQMKEIEERYREILVKYGFDK